jgi:hypothetical protein
MELMPLEQLSHADFAARVNSKFRVWLEPADSIELELAEVTPRRLVTAPGPSRAAYESFALRFIGPADHLLVQRIYQFELAALGRFEIFIVPVGRDEGGFQYEAAFNRQLPGN